MQSAELTTIKITKKVRDKLRGLGKKGESYTKLLTRILNEMGDGKNELEKIHS